MSKTRNFELKTVEEVLAEARIPRNEARLLLALIKAGGEARASRLATLSGIPRTEVYRILRNLEKKGLVYAKASIPKVYVSLKPREVAEQIVNLWRKKLKFIESRVEKVIKALEAVEEKAYIGSDKLCDVFLLRGWEGTKFRAVNLIRCSKKSVEAALSFNVAQDELLTAIKRRARRLRIRLVLEHSICTRHEKLKCEVRRLRKLPVSVIVADGKRALVILHKSRVEKLGLLFCEAGAVEACKMLFEKLWEEAAP